jgi:hypothetical protein
MDRREGGTVSAGFAAGSAPARSESIALRQGHAAWGRATRRAAAAAGRPSPVSSLRDGTATGAATRDTGSARRRLSHDRPCPIPALRRTPPPRPGLQRNTEILTR